MAWLPNFWDPLVVLRSILVAVCIAILLTLLRTGFFGIDLAVLGAVTFLSVWIICLSAVGLQMLRRFGEHLPIWIGSLLAVIWMLASAAICTTVPFWLGLPLSIVSDEGIVEMVLETMLITLIVGTVVLRTLFTHHEIQENSKRLLDAKYDALQARIRPHFLFNSLNSVAELINIDAERAENALLDLSDLFRATLSQQGSVQIKQELALCEKYLCVEKLRMGDRLAWQFRVDEEAMSWFIPALSFQPLLENAVLHGVQPLPEGGLIELELKVLGPKLMLQMTNPMSSRVDTESRGTGTALKNVKSRFESFYKTPVGFSARQVENQYLVEISIPKASMMAEQQ